MDMREINQGVIAEFRANGGELSGPMAGAPILLLTTTGRTSGSSHTTPVGFIDDGGRLVAAAANGGSEEHPDWFKNIQRNGTITVEVPGKEIEAVVEIAEGATRERLLAALASSLPGMSEHLAATTREVPVVFLT